MLSLITFLLFNNVLSIDIIQLTDIHYDNIMDASKYDVTTSCRGGQHRMSEKVKKLYRKVPLPSNPIYGLFYCDTNYNLMKEAIVHSVEVSPAPGLIILSGDIAAHGLGSYLTDSVTTVLTTLKRRYSGVPVVFSIGNNDVSPSYYVFCNDSRYQIYYDVFEAEIPLSEKDEYLIHGTYFKHFTNFGFSVISMNTLLFGYKLNGNDCGALKYIQNAFDEIRSKGNKVIVVGHFPFGVAAYDCKQYLDNSIQSDLLDILKQNSDITIATMFGHDHRAEIKQFDSISAYTAPAVSPCFGNAPGFRVYSYDKTTRTIADFKDYFFQLTASSSKGEPSWTKPISFVETYNLPDASPDSIKQANASIWKDTITYTKYASLANGFFDSNYKSNECLIMSGNEEEFEECLESII